MSVVEIDRGYIGVSEDASLNYFEMAGSSSGGVSNNKENFHNWESKAIDIDNYKVIPNGKNNDNPKIIQQTTLPNAIAPRILARKVELLVDQFPYLYKVEKGVRTPEDNDTIMQWLDSMNIVDNVIANATNYYYSNEVYTKIYRSKEARISSTIAIAKIESVSGFDARVAYLKTSKTKIPTHVIIGDWYSGGNNADFKVYPIFNPLDPNKYPVSIHIASLKTYGMRYYPLPEIWGVLSWIERNTAIPFILKALTDNSLNIKWHITSPKEYWDDKRKQLEQDCKDKKITYKEKMLDDLRKKILDGLSKLLSGVDNVGKFWHNEEVIKLVGGKAEKTGWTIKPIEQKIKDYVGAQLEVALSSAKFVLSGLGLHSALANVGADGKSDSGSEQIYAYKIHQYTSTRLPEYYVLKAINDVIKLKFKTNLKLGFKRAKIDTEAETTPNSRMKNKNDE